MHVLKICRIVNGSRREYEIRDSKKDEEGSHHAVKFAFGAIVVSDGMGTAAKYKRVQGWKSSPPGSLLSGSEDLRGRRAGGGAGIP